MLSLAWILAREFVWCLVDDNLDMNGNELIVYNHSSIHAKDIRLKFESIHVDDESDIILIR